MGRSPRRRAAQPTGITLSAHDAERIIRVVAAQVRCRSPPATPILSAELPLTGERFEGVFPPVVARADLRHPQARGVGHSLATTSRGVMTANRRRLPARRRAARQTSSLPAAPAPARPRWPMRCCTRSRDGRSGHPARRHESSCMPRRRPRAAAHVSGRGEPRRAVRSTLRLRPDRIVVGEVRGAEALDLLKAWGTGHPGGSPPFTRARRRGALARLGAADPRSRPHRAAAAHRRSRQRHRVPRRPRPGARREPEIVRSCRGLARLMPLGYRLIPHTSPGRTRMLNVSTPAVQRSSRSRLAAALIAVLRIARLRRRLNMPWEARCNRSSTRSRGRWRRSSR